MEATDTCAICAQIDPALSNVENAKRIGTTESSIRRHKKHSPVLDTDDFFTDIPTQYITSRGQSIRLADGSWQKVTYRPSAMALAEALKYDDLSALIAAYKAPEVKPALYSEHALVVCAADFQVGKAREGRGGTAELTERVMASWNAAALRAAETSPKEIVILDCGDIIENFQNTGSQAQTNDKALTEQVRIARRLMWEGIKLLAPHCERLIYAAVPSNHCQVRAQGSKDLASVPEDDWGIEIAYQIGDILDGCANPDLAHVRVVVPDPLAESLCVRVAGTTLGVVHGHQSRSADKIGEWWKGQSHGRRNGLDQADILVHGHYHTFSIRQSGDARWLIGAPSSDGGSTWFTNATGEQSLPGMLIFHVQEGMWALPEIV